MDDIGIRHADCGGDWTLMDGTAYCERCGKTQDVRLFNGTPMLSGVVLAPWKA